MFSNKFSKENRTNTQELLSSKKMPIYFQPNSSKLRVFAIFLLIDLGFKSADSNTKFLLLKIVEPGNGGACL